MMRTRRHEYAFVLVVQFLAVGRCLMDRRAALLTGATGGAGAVMRPPLGPEWSVLTDDEGSGYSALVYTPPSATLGRKFPLLVSLSGAGQNDRDAYDLANPYGEHRGLPPCLLATGRAPTELKSFCVVAPYASGLRSFASEPRSKLLSLIRLAVERLPVDEANVALFGFSDGATVGVEIATSGCFKACVLAATGLLQPPPARALELLRGVSFWVFHSADDVVYPVRCSDQLVGSLRSSGCEVRYSRFEVDPEGGFEESRKGHTVGFTAARSPEVYEWLRSKLSC